MWLINLSYILFIMRNVVTHFWIPAQKRRKYKKIKNICSKKPKKYITVKQGCQSAQIWLKLGWGGSKIQRLKFDSILLTDESPVDK